MEIQVFRPATVSGRAVGYARRKLAHLARYSREPVQYARLTFSVSANPAVPRPVRVHATLDIDGRVVHAHADGTGVRQAVDALDDRLRRQMIRVNPHWQNRGRTLRRDPVPEQAPTDARTDASPDPGGTEDTTKPLRPKAF